MPYPPFSYSALTDYEGCPRRFLEVKILKKWPFTETEALTYGKETHKSFENRVKHGTKLPPHLEHCEPLIAGLETAGYKLYAEIDIAITRDFKPVDYWDKSAWFRGSVDVLAIKGNEMIMLDWKTGKRYVARGYDNPETGQLKLYALLLSITGAALIRGVYVWLSSKQQDTVIVTPETVGEIREEYTERAAKFEAALQRPPEDAETWTTRPSPLCGFCPVIDCEAGKKHRERRAARQKYNR